LPTSTEHATPLDSLWPLFINKNSRQSSHIPCYALLCEPLVEQAADPQEVKVSLFSRGCIASRGSGAKRESY